MRNFTIETGTDGVALIRFDSPGQSMNTLTRDAIAEIGDVADRLAADPAIRGAIILSGKQSGFCAGGDLTELEQDIARWRGASTQDELAVAAAEAGCLSRNLRRLERCGKPLVAVIAGLALGGGLELAMACHWRIVADDPRIRLGLPEAGIGLLAGGGGTQRLPRLIGLQAALPILLDGRTLDPAKALAAGLVDRIVPADTLLAAAREWVLSAPEKLVRWDEKGFTPPGGGPWTQAGMQLMAAANATLRARTAGNEPAKENALRAMFEGVQVPIDAGLRIENRFFLNTVRTPQATAMVRTLFHAMRQVGRPARRDRPFRPRLAAVLGAGMMGGGIAHALALAGIETVLIDQDAETAARGRDKAVALLDAAVKAGRLPAKMAAQAATRIRPAANYADMDGAELVIEAVFEDRAVKAAVTRAAAERMAPGGLFASNTSTLPIDGLADAFPHPDRFIGLHFFSPVDRMKLVEVIVGPRTAPDTLADALDVVAAIGKTPITVKDRRGFYTSRVFATYLAEGFEMLAEGYAPTLIDNAGRLAGMPRGPLELADDVGLDLLLRIRRQNAADLGAAYLPDAQDTIVPVLVETHGRLGRKNAAGLYDYPAGSRKRVWPGLMAAAGATGAGADAAPLTERLLYRQAVEAARCLAEGVIADPRHGDVGAVLGWGFPGWTGGPLSFIDGIGRDRFAARAAELAARHGPRFAPSGIA